MRLHAALAGRAGTARADRRARDSCAHNILVYVALVLVAAMWWLSTARALDCACARSARTRTWSRPPASRCVRLRYTALTLNGVLCGLAGAYLVLAQNAAFGPNMTAGAATWRSPR